MREIIPQPNPDRKPTNEEQIPEEQISLEAIQEKRQQVLTTLEKARDLPPNWVTNSGKGRDDVIAELESSLDDLDQMESNIIAQESETEAGVAKEEKEEESLSEREGRYWRIGGADAPICESPTKTEKWESIPGKFSVSGGKKFSEVRFLKDVGGLTLTAKPGSPLDFSEKYRGEYLNSIDTVLEGHKEVRTFNEIRERLARFIHTYEELNPDDPAYDTEAKKLAEKINKFTDAEGLREVIDLDGRGLENVEDFAERIADIFRTQEFLRSLDEGFAEFVPPRNPNFKLTPFVKRKMGWFAQLVNRQLGLGNNSYLKELVENKQAPKWEHLSAKGMTVVVGPRGTGKNQLVESYCAETNRPLYRYAASPDKQERDLTYDVELQDGETVRVPTRILSAVTTPNAMLVLDEINLLRPEVAKFFNSLLDGDRAIFMNDQVIKAAAGTIFVGLMNPADYDGVEDLPETIDDRSNVMTLGYPPFQEIDPKTGSERFTENEALTLKAYIHPLADLSDKEFQEAWNYVINNDHSAQISLDPEQIRALKDLKNIVAIADRTRQVVESYKTRTGNLRMEREISLRGSMAAAQFYSENKLWKVRLSDMPDYENGWNAAQYAIATTYMPHTNTYKRGTQSDRNAMQMILKEAIE